MNGHDNRQGHPGNRQPDPLSWMGDNDWERMTVLKVLMLGGLAVGPVMAAALWRGTEVWLLELGVLVPAGQALVTVPSWQSGLDLQRVVVGAFLLLAALCLLVHLPGREERAA